MCGLTGAVWTDPAKALDRAALERMIAVLAHRGPDDRGGYAAEAQSSAAADATPGVALGHRRLSIIDVAGGHQPLSNENGRVWVVFNGEIYNHHALRRELEAAGHQFRTRSDTEVLVHLYEHVGIDMPTRLDGMFALALWDADRGQLLLARDRLGEKPLVYREEHGRLLFASELKSILEAPGVPRRVAPAALDAYLTYQYVPDPLTIYEGIAKLPPAHRAVYRNGHLKVEPYWQPDFQHEDRRGPEELAAEVRTRLREAVAARLESEVPLGAFLSGGIDSTIIVGLMRELSTGPVRTFSIGFNEADYDESVYARLVAHHFQTDHTELRVQPDAVAMLPKLAWHFDEPFADSSALPTWYVAQLARPHVTVALTGDGGDELFVGYPRYLAVDWASHLDRAPRSVRQVVARTAASLLPQGRSQRSLTRRLRRFAEVLPLSPAQRYLDWISIFNASRRHALYIPELRQSLADVSTERFLITAWGRAAARDPVTAASLADLVTYLPGDLLTKVDRMSMAHALECRPPFLDHHLVELAASIPRRWKLRFGRGKWLLRRAFGDLIPPPILARGKMGFGVPLEPWFRHQLREYAREILFDPLTRRRGYFLSKAVTQLWDEHQSGRFNHAYRLWSLLMLELWHRTWLDP